MTPTDSPEEWLNGRSGVTRSLLAGSLALMVALIGVVFGLVQSRINGIEERVLRVEAIVNARGERIAILEAARSENNGSLGRVETRIFGIEDRIRELEIGQGRIPGARRGLRGDP